MVVVTTPGVMVGTIATQYQSDKFGRRSTLLASAVPFCVGTVGYPYFFISIGRVVRSLFNFCFVLQMFVLFATKVWTLCIARFFWGVGAGMIQTVRSRKMY